MPVVVSDQPSGLTSVVGPICELIVELLISHPGAPPEKAQPSTAPHTTATRTALRITVSMVLSSQDFCFGPSPAFARASTSFATSPDGSGDTGPRPFATDRIRA